jgi:phage tail sheath protein FI
MTRTYQTPGVYTEDIFLQPAAKLPTGVVGFVGFANVGTQGPVPFNSPVALHRKEEFAINFGSRPESYLGECVTGFFENGGVRCYVVRADAELTAGPVSALQAAIDALAPVNDLDLLAVPDAMSLRLPNGEPDVASIVLVQQHALAHCATEGNRLAILDALPSDPLHSPTVAVLKQRESLTVGQAEPVNGALYFPWLRNVNGRFVPPSGHVGGIFARTDGKVGVFKAPANEEVFGVLDLDATIDDSIQDQLNPVGVNCLRAFPRRGIRVWGARTLSRDINWRYVNVRRLFLTLRRWIDLNMAWATFEPNDERLWVRIQRELKTYLKKLLQDGALKGVTPNEAFYVKCDSETNPPEVREVGQVVTEIGLAPQTPSEFIVVRIVHRAASERVA